MAVPWLALVDALLGVTNFVLRRRIRRTAEEPETPSAPARVLGQLESHLAGVVVAALKEAFDRDASRLALEREQREFERVRAERLFKIERLRQAGDREIARLRLMAGVATWAWIGTLLLATRLIGGPIGARIMLGAGWLLLLAALALSFAAQSRVGRALARFEDPIGRHDDLDGGAAGAFVPWLILCGLAVIGLAALIV